MNGLRVAFAIATLVTLAACGRPTGDFGRVRSDTFSDRLATGAQRLGSAVTEKEALAGELTDEEHEMRDRMWRFIDAPDAIAWSRKPRAGGEDTPDRRTQAYYVPSYYERLRGADFRSPRVRYNRLVADIDGDIATLGPTFQSVCAVIEMDKRRVTAAQSLGLSAAPEGQAVARRADRNRHAMTAFAQRLQDRQDGYTYALERLLLDSPYEEARLVDGRLSELSVFVGRATNIDYCEAAPGPVNLAGR